MGASKHIKAAMAFKKIKTSEVAETIGLTSGVLSTKLYRDSMTFTDAEAIADALGCDVVLRDRETGQYF